MIYTISEKEPISSCVLESESVFNPDSNSNNDDNENTSFSSTQYGNKNINNSDSNSNLKIYISRNNEDIMPECAHDTDARFDLRYLGKEVIKLEPNSCTCIDLKIALEIPATIIVQLVSKSSLVKKRINIRGGIIDVRYIGNIITMLQNNLGKAYIIEPNEKIA
ncbi:hypothetical protein G9A89_020415 [Geosiphon pyriformis]|nr:hypothetical protein G9A89_020415 [Geosiphon pyriformis]